MTARVTAALRDSSSVRAVREALGDTTGIWIVGGAVRDAALGYEVLDLDLAVAGGENEVAHRIARATAGHAFELSAEFGTWRAISSGGWRVDVTRLRGASIEVDLGLRDLAANAIAVELGDLAGAPLDPHGGLADLDRRLLRAVGPRSFEDDPLRILRAARLAAGLGFELEPATVELARAASPRAGEPAGERQLAELRLVLAGPDPLRGLRLMDELGATATVLPEIEALRGVEQNPNHHLDVHGHTMEVLEHLLAVETAVDRYAGDRAAEVTALLDESLADELTRRGALRFGALVHDVGKPATRGQSGGYITFIGHDRVGAEIVAGLCERLKTSRRLSDHLQGLTRHHLRLGFLAGEAMRADGRLSPPQVHAYLRATGRVSADVTLLTIADRLAARGGGPIAAPQMVEAHLALAREMLAATLDWRRDGPPAVPIRGDELAAELGLEPGPRLGELLLEIEAAVYAGEVGDRDGALALARRLGAGSRSTL